MQREARALLQWDGSPELAEVDGAPGKPLGDALKRDTSSTGCAGVGSLGQPGRRGGGLPVVDDVDSATRPPVRVGSGSPAFGQGLPFWS